MSPRTRQSIWRGFGHSYLLMSLGAMILGSFEITEWLTMHSGHHVFLSRIAYGQTGRCLMALAMIIGFVLLSVSSYRRSQGKPIFVHIAALICMTIVVHSLRAYAIHKTIGIVDWSYQSRPVIWLVLVPLSPFVVFRGCSITPVQAAASQN